MICVSFTDLFYFILFLEVDPKITELNTCSSAVFCRTEVRKNTGKESD